MVPFELRRGPDASNMVLIERYSILLGDSFVGSNNELACRRAVMMLDHPEKTSRLLGALKAVAPFKVELLRSLIEHLQAENVVDSGRMHQVVSDLSYAGDEGGIMCHMSRSEETGRALVVSLTYIRVPRSMPLARAIADYQKHRVTKLKKQGER